jgi:hypothetical protein
VGKNFEVKCPDLIATFENSPGARKETNEKSGSFLRYFIQNKLFVFGETVPNGPGTPPSRGF